MHDIVISVERQRPIYSSDGELLFTIDTARIATILVQPDRQALSATVHRGIVRDGVFCPVDRVLNVHIEGEEWSEFVESAGDGNKTRLGNIEAAIEAYLVAKGFI